MKLIYHHFDSLNSTNDWGKAHLHALPRDAASIVSADHQTDGRGQQGKKWVSPQGKNLYMSICYFINEEKYDPVFITYQLAQSLCHVLEKKSINCTVKWPNDVLVNNKKIAGILCETRSFSPLIGVVIGLGLNVNMKKEQLKQIDQPATSLFEETGKIEDVQALLQQICTYFFDRVSITINATDPYSE